MTARKRAWGFSTAGRMLSKRLTKVQSSMLLKFQFFALAGG